MTLGIMRKHAGRKRRIKIKLINGDCLDLMGEIPSGSVDMILCDLPYGTTSSRWDKVIPFDRLWPHYERVIKGNGAIVLFGAESIHLPEWIGQARSNSAGDNWKLFIKNRSVGKIVCMPIEAYKKIMTMIYAFGGSGDGK